MGILSALETYAIEDQLVKDRASLAAMLADRAAGKDVRDSDIRIWTQAVDRGSRQLEKIRFQKALDADRAENDRIHHRERVQNANEIARRSDQLENERRLERESANLEKRKQYESDFHASKYEIVEWLEALNNGEDIEERYDISPLEAIQCAISWTSSEDMALMPASFLRAHNWLKYGIDKNNEFWGDEKYAAFDIDDFEDEEDYRWIASRHNFEKVLYEALNPWDDVTRFSLDIEYDSWPIDKEYNLTGPMTLQDGKLVWAGESTKRRGILFLCGNESTHSLEVFRKASMPLPERIEAPGDFDERRGGELSRSVYPWVFMDNTGDYLTVIDVPSSINTLYQYDEKSDSFEKKSEFRLFEKDIECIPWIKSPEHWQEIAKTNTTTYAWYSYVSYYKKSHSGRNAQLVRIPGTDRVILLILVSEMIRPDGQSRGKNFAIDAVSGRLLWSWNLHLKEEACFEKLQIELDNGWNFHEGWRLTEGTGIDRTSPYLYAYCLLRCEKKIEIPNNELPQPPKGFFAKIFGGNEPKPLEVKYETETQYAYVIGKVDLLTGNILNVSEKIHKDTKVYGNPELRIDGDVLKYSRGKEVINLSPASLRLIDPELNSTGTSTPSVRLGLNPLHTMIQLIKYREPEDTEKNHARLVKK